MLLIEGPVGHMAHPYESHDMTFRELIDIFKVASQGFPKINVTEKDHAMFADFIEWVNSYNKYVFSEWNNHSNNDVDKKLVEEFIDMEDGIAVVS